MSIEVRTQAELDRALANAGRGDLIEIRGNGHFDLSASDSATVRAYGSATVWASGSATVRASDSATVWASGSVTVWACDSTTVSACDSATVRASDSATVWAYDSTTVSASDSATVWASGSVTVWACDSVTVRASGSTTVWAYDSTTVSAYDSTTVRASNYVAVHKHTPTVTVIGGVVIEPRSPQTIAEWCDNYGLTVEDGIVVLFKAVDDDFRAHHNGFEYLPGTAPESPDWDGGKNECGGGLHFSPSPGHALAFNVEASRFVGCPVRVDELVLHPDGLYPSKVKAPRVAAPCFEVDLMGVPVGETVS